MSKSIEEGPVVEVVHTKLLESGDVQLLVSERCRSAAMLLLLCSLFRFASLEGVVGLVSAALFLCTTRSNFVRGSAHRARCLRLSAIIVSVLACFGAFAMVATSTVLIPRLGTSAEAYCVSRNTAQPPHVGQSGLPVIEVHPVWLVSACPGRVLSQHTSKESPTDPVSDSIAKSVVDLLQPLPHASPSQCHHLGNTVKVVGSIGMLILLASELALGLAAVNTYLSAKSLIEFVNAAGPNVIDCVSVSGAVPPGWARV